MFLLIYLSVISTNILMMNCDEICNCQEISVLKEIVQQVLLEQKLESSKLRKIEARQRSITALSGTTDNGLGDRLLEMETKIADIDAKLEALDKERQEDADKTGNINHIVKKALASEKLQRVQFISGMESEMAEMKKTFEKFKADTNTRISESIENISLSENDFKQNINEKLKDIKGQTENLVGKVLTDVTTFQDDFQLEINEKLKDIKIMNQRLLETEKAITALDDLVVKDTIDGDWTLWGGWSSCSVSCGSGVKYRSRSCSSPSPSVFGRQCEGNSRQTDSCGLKICPDNRVAFTAYGIDAGTDSATVRFPTTIVNFGNSYSSTTGKFTCRVPGIYHFAVTLSIRLQKEHMVINCNIFLNSSEKLELYAIKHDHDSNNSFPVSVAGVLHLNLGDTVYIGNCGEYNSIFNDDSTVFMGILVSADV